MESWAVPLGALIVSLATLIFSATQISRKADGERLMRPVRMSDADALAIEVVGRMGFTPVVVPRGKRDPEIERVLTARRLEDGILGVLMAKQDVIGLIVVGNRVGEPATFQPEDASIFATFSEVFSPTFIRKRASYRPSPPKRVPGP